MKTVQIGSEAGTIGETKGGAAGSAAPRHGPVELVALLLHMLRNRRIAPVRAGLRVGNQSRRTGRDRRDAGRRRRAWP